MYSIPFLDLPPLRRAAGTVRLPGSKSISNRVLLLAGLADGEALVRDVLVSDDTKVMLDALLALGARIEPSDEGLRVRGIGGQLGAANAEIFLGNSGTSARSLTPVIALLAATQGGAFELRGIPRMHERPIGDLVDALRPLGCHIDYLGAEGYPPLRIAGEAGGRIADGPIAVRGNASSQFLTGLLLALPLACERADRVVEVRGELISKPYVEITLALLRRFGIEVQREGWQRFTIPRGSRYRSPGQIRVEGDASSASYFIALGAIAADREPLRIEGVGDDSIQGDIRFVEAVRAMGAEIASGPGWLEVRRGAPGKGWPLRALDLDCNHIPDAAMTLAVMALYARGATRLRNIASWRVKETDRIAAMATELGKLGAQVVEGADFLEVSPPPAWRPAAIETYDDHRMAMCFSLAAFNGLAGSRGDPDAPGLPVRILDPRCVGKTFPEYFETLLDVVEAHPADVPVITVDGPTASGKGTLAVALAHALGYHHLDSGALYRATAVVALQRGVAADDAAGLAAIAGGLDLRFAAGRAVLDGQDAQDELRREEVGALASVISALPAVRAALHGRQLSFRRAPGLVADGRDMGTVVFPDATLKVFLTASAATRADRRYKQLISKGVSSNIDSLRSALESRDTRDISRTSSPLMPAADAALLDNSDLTIDTSVDLVLKWWSDRRPFGRESIENRSDSGPRPEPRP